jgi:hypothetical protein
VFAHFFNNLKPIKNYFFRKVLSLDAEHNDDFFFVLFWYYSFFVFLVKRNKIGAQTIERRKKNLLNSVKSFIEGDEHFFVFFYFIRGEGVKGGSGKKKKKKTGFSPIR